MHRNDGRVVSNLIVQALRGEPITICGDETQIPSFRFVNDLIEGIFRLMATDETMLGPINLETRDEVTIDELAEIIISPTDSGSPLVFKLLPVNDPVQRKPDITLARQKLEWRPKVELREGLKRTIDYFS